MDELMRNDIYNVKVQGNEDTDNMDTVSVITDYTNADSNGADNVYSHNYAGSNVTNGNKNNRNRRNRRNNKFSKKMAAVAMSAILFGTFASGAYQLTDYVGHKYLNNEESEVENASKNVLNDENIRQVANTNSASTTEYKSAVSDVASTAMPAIVSITNKSVQEVQSMFGYGQNQEYESESSGSGIIVGQNDTELLIATNNHVVDGADTLSVRFTDETVVEAKIKGSDTENDLAVIAVDLDDITEDTMNQIAIASLGDSDELIVGEQVVAIGNALGYGQSVTTGIVSALNRSISLENTADSLIQTDAAINPGNSGGALVNMKGEVIGINSAKYTDTSVEGMGYAIPISYAEPIISGLMEQTTKEKVAEEVKGYLPVLEGVDVTSEVSKTYDMPIGLYVQSVIDSSNAGLQKGDIITAIDGRSVSTYTDIETKLQYYSTGETVILTVQRESTDGYTEVSVEVTLVSHDDLSRQSEGQSDSIYGGSQGQR